MFLAFWFEIAYVGPKDKEIYLLWQTGCLSGSSHCWIEVKFCILEISVR